MLTQVTNTRTVHLILTVGVVAVSFAAIFIRLADAPPLVIASYRLTIAAVVMVGLAAGSWLRSGRVAPTKLTRKDMVLLGVSSTSLALHFWVWILSLEYTSVASSVVLVTTNSFIVAVASRVLFKEALHPHTVVGIAVGISGGVVIALGDAGSDEGLLGDLLAFGGAVAIVGYMLTGRTLRRHMSVLTYNTWVYTGTAAILLVAATVAGGPFTGFTSETYLWMVMLALVPQVIGHSLLNWSLAHVTATAVTVAVMAEPVLAIALAIPILGEVPPWTSVLGGVLVLSGIYVALRNRRTEAQTQVWRMN